MPQRKVMIIGLDAATLDLVRPWAAQGHLPNMRRFLENGAAGPLRSTVPIMSPAAWSTFATGVNPGQHGVLIFYQLKPDSYEPYLMNAARRRGATFWEVAGQQGVRGGVINVPFTYPPRAYNGFLISGMLSPGANLRMARPPSVFEDLMASSPDYTVDVDMVNAAGQDPEMILGRILATVRTRLRAAVGLYRKHRPPLFCVVFVAGDRVSHYFWNYMESLRAGQARTPAQKRLGRAIQLVYEELDKAVGTLVAEASKDTDVLILSDHGTGPIRKGLNLRKVLAGAGLLQEEPPGLADRLKRRAVWAFARHVPGPIKGTIKTWFPALAQRAAGVVACRGIDFARTRAYPAGETEGVFVNLRGRQPCGTVEPGAEYEAVRDRVIEVLSGLTDPQTGQAVARGVYRREEVWSGPCLEQLPDVVMEQEERIYDVPTFSEHTGQGVFYHLPKASWTALRRLGGHRRNGLILGMGPHIKHTEVHNADIADVPATVLALLGCAIPENFDGRVLSEMLTEDVKPARRMAACVPKQGTKDDFTAEDRAAVEERLRGLGYL